MKREDAKEALNFSLKMKKKKPTFYSLPVQSTSPFGPDQDWTEDLIRHKFRTEDWIEVTRSGLVEADLRSGPVRDRIMNILIG